MVSWKINQCRIQPIYAYIHWPRMLPCFLLFEKGLVYYHRHRGTPSVNTVRVGAVDDISHGSEVCWFGVGSFGYDEMIFWLNFSLACHVWLSSNFCQGRFFLGGFRLIKIHLQAYWIDMDLLRSVPPDIACRKLRYS